MARPTLRVIVTSHTNINEKTTSSKTARLISPVAKGTAPTTSEMKTLRVVRPTEWCMPRRVHLLEPSARAKATTAPDEPRSWMKTLVLKGTNPMIDRCTPMRATSRGTMKAARRFVNTSVPTCLSISQRRRAASSTSSALETTTPELKT